jgi:exodeoxyribonuclease-3
LVLLATWNVNSLKQRLPRVLEFLAAHRPAVVCLQETKVAADTFPHDELAEAGYVAAEHSAGRWAGVAILAPSDRAPSDVVCGLPGEAQPDEARWIEATVGDVRVGSVYVPNGRALDNPAFSDKLAFLDALADRARDLAGAGTPLVIAGDFNIAPSDADVYDPGVFVGSTHTSAQERERLAAVLDAGLVDAFPHVDTGEGIRFTWWDYRAGHFHKGLGMRIDLVLLSRDLAERCRTCGIDRAFRKGSKPSDHAPLLVDLGP